MPHILYIGAMMIIINTGEGKGKTTAAMGQIIRALGHGKRVCLIQLFKAKEFYGEQNILTKLELLSFFSYAPFHPFCVKTARISDVLSQCALALEHLAQIAAAKNLYDLIVLDEFNIALRDNFIDKAKFLPLVKVLSSQADIVITGRGAPRELIDAADIVSEMKEIKHHYRKGIGARSSIEF
ncbi:MAG: cob(I)yrinic acid a,c-diamide adenosyltransferase [Elusimicrobiota bacterium]|nr:cob(I)yrinic acid a,c-diamide adenosyltransferase [Elusimicrobiota bacterium]